MSTKAIIISAAIALIAVGAAVTFVLVVSNRQMESSPNTNISEQNNEDTEDSTVETSTSAQAFMDSGESKRCTYVDGEHTGTMYFSNYRLRTDYQSNTQSGGMIVTSGTQYVWDNNEKAGFMFQFSGDELSSEDMGSVDLEQEYNFSCSDWTADESMFVVPSDITITDFSSFSF